MNRKLIYILNSYSTKSSEHYYHVINLLNEIAQNNIEIYLVIENANTIPPNLHKNITAYALKKKGVFRILELFSLLVELVKKGYNKVYVRISNWGAVTSVFVGFFHKLDVYYWHSGTVYEFDNAQKLSFKKVIWFFRTRLPFLFVAKYTTFFVTGPEKMKDYYADVVGIERNKIIILYNDIDTSRFTYDKGLRVEFRRQLGIPKNSLMILFVHNFSPVRRTNYYVQNFMKQFKESIDLSNYCIYFIGEGQDKKEVENEVERLGLNNEVKFLGAKANAEVHKYYQCADIFINPTHAEGFPRVILEAMACGLPIVTTNAGGIEDLLGQRQKNFISDRNSPDEFRSRLFDMISLDKEAITAIRAENLELVKAYDTKVVAKMYIDTILNEKN